MNRMSGIVAFAVWAGIASAAEINQPPSGFTALFNGKDLTNWKDAAKQAEHWKVVDGVLEYDGKGKDLITEKNYKNFELYCDWKIDAKGDSGLYLRGKPQVQIWDNPVGSGGLYNNKKGPSKPLVIADNKVGEWNTFHIKMVGDKVTVTLNGKLVVDNVALEHWPKYDSPLPAEGTIWLQHHGSKLWFRNVFIKELE